MKRYFFSSTRLAYADCQAGNIKKGSTLVIESERVVAVADTWPFAVTKECVSIHAKAPGHSWEDVAGATGIPMACIEAAIAEAKARGWEVAA